MHADALSPDISIGNMACVAAAEKATRVVDNTHDPTPLEKKLPKLLDVMHEIGSSLKNALSMPAVRATLLMLTFTFLMALVTSGHPAFKEHEGLLPMTIITNPRQLSDAQVGSPAHAPQDGSSCHTGGLTSPPPPNHTPLDEICLAIWGKKYKHMAHRIQVRQLT